MLSVDQMAQNNIIERLVQVELLNPVYAKSTSLHKRQNWLVVQMDIGQGFAITWELFQLVLCVE